MNTHQTIVVFILFVWFCGRPIDCYSFDVKMITMDKYSACPQDEKNIIRFNGTFTNIALNKYVTNGEITLKANVGGPIEVQKLRRICIVLAEKHFFNSIFFNKSFNLQFQTIATRCDFNFTTCETYDTFSFPDICKVMNLQNTMWIDFGEHLHPKLKCPLKMSSIKIDNAIIDFAWISRLPLDGYKWVNSFKLFKQIPHVRHRKQLLFCLMSEATITKLRRRQWWKWTL